MILEYYSSPVKDLPDEWYKLCYSNNLRKYGMMRNTLVTLRSDPVFNNYSKATLIWADGNFIGWSLSFRYYKFDPITSYFWIKKSYRRQGYGTILYYLTKKSIGNQKMLTEGWNAASFSFFDSLSEEKKYVISICK